MTDNYKGLWYNDVIDINVSNNYIAVHYSAKHMNFLHCFYGIGITVSPIILAKTMEAASGWRNGYRIAFAIQILITLLLFVTLPWWRKRGHNQEDNEEPVLVRPPAVKLDERNTAEMPYFSYFFVVGCACRNV